ncbi:PREDICTED: SLAM family member 6 [Odobenus rosmarus divergens]|uniref:SLAM family member 6 n=1 Tax=Odobenus rosmarus divergens TaxID=9708 RepID=A0A9B0GX79_ODORO
MSSFLTLGYLRADSLSAPSLAFATTTDFSSAFRRMTLGDNSNLPLKAVLSTQLMPAEIILSKHTQCGRWISGEVSTLMVGNTASQDSSNPLTVNGVLGESVTLSLKLPVHQDIQSITWLHNGKSINFILPKAAPDLRISVTDPKRKDRLQLMENYSLQLSNLATADAGLYCAQITTQTSTEFSYYTLQIFRRLRNLQIANHTWLSEIGTCEIHLTCSVENSNDTFLRWQVVGNTSINEANLTISWDPRNSSEQKFTCVAENTVSNISFSVSTQSLCEGVLNMKNHPDTKWIIIVVVVILICIVITVGLLVWRKKDCLWRTGIFHFSTPQTQSPGELADS